MKVSTLTGIVVLLLLLAAGRPALALETIGWDGLVPAVDDSLDPYLRLSEDEQESLYDLWMLREISAVDTLDEGLKEKQQEAAANLEASGIDPDEILKELDIFMDALEANQSRLVESLDGKDVRIPGYVLPTEFSGSKVVEFLLVPYVGACVHTPAPPINQMVHVKVEGGFTNEGLFAPVWVTGQINTAMSTQSVSFNDGAMDVEAGYQIKAVDVAPYE